MLLTELDQFMNEASFQTLITQARSGNSEAAAQMIKRYEPALRREIRMYHTDPNLKRVLDTSDVVQSVLGNFFIRLAAGQFDLEHPGQLVRLLSRMARNKIINHARSNKRLADLGSASAVIGKLEHPSEIVARKDLLEKIHELLTEEERQIAGKRTGGLTWQQLADELGGDAESLRKRYARALNRVAGYFQMDAIEG